MVTVTRVLAVTALDVCQRAPSELALAGGRDTPQSLTTLQGGEELHEGTGAGDGQK